MSMATSAPPQAISRAINIKDFSGGMNNQDDLSSVANNELPSIINLEVSSTGALVGRPPITKFSNLPTANVAAEFLGYFSRSDGTNFVVIAHNGLTYLWEPIGNAYTSIASFPASGCAQYQNRLYLCARATRGGWWGEITPGSGSYSYQSLATGGTPMPFGDQIILFKNRLWISGWGSSDERTKLYLSDITNTVGGDINNWPVLNFIYVSRGDGQWITKLHAGPNDLTVFRNASSFWFNYDSDPGLGTLRQYEGTIGAENKYSVAVYQNYVYTLSNGGLYQLLGYQYYRRNDPDKLLFQSKSTATPYGITAAMSVIGKRLLIWYQGSVYAFNLNSLLWTQWDSPVTQGAYFVVAPKAENSFGPDVAYGITGSGEVAKQAMYRVVDEIDAVNKESMVHFIRTKAYDFDTPDKFKVMFWWSADLLVYGSVSGNAIPVVLAYAATTFDDMDHVTFDQLNLGTWDNPLTKAPGVTTTWPGPPGFPYRVSAKFRKKMRFRRVYFEVSMVTDGSSATGPAHIFGLVTYVALKQKITKGIQ